MIPLTIFAFVIATVAAYSLGHKRGVGLERSRTAGLILSANVAHRFVRHMQGDACDFAAVGEVMDVMRKIGGPLMTDRDRAIQEAMRRIAEERDSEREDIDRAAERIKCEAAS